MTAPLMPSSLKSAVFPAPLPTMPPLQLVGVPQSPPVVAVQVYVCAKDVPARKDDAARVSKVRPNNASTWRPTK